MRSRLFLLKIMFVTLAIGILASSVLTQSVQNDPPGIVRKRGVELQASAANVQIGSASATVHEHLGDVYDRMARAEQARAAWTKALSLSTSPAQSTRIKAKLSGDVKK